MATKKKMKTANVDRQEVLSTLKHLLPALSPLDLVPVLQHFCFDGKNVLTYNDVIAIEAKMSIGFSGTLPANRFYKLLDSFNAGTFVVSKENEVATITCGKSKATLPSLSVDSFVYKKPKDEGSTEIVLNHALIKAFKIVLLSVGDDPIQTWQMGVSIGKSVAGNAKALSLFSTDGRSITHAEVECYGAENIKDPISLPTQFVKQIVTHADSGEVLVIGDKQVTIQTSELFIATKILRSSFARISDAVSSFGTSDCLSSCALPEGLASACTRALVIAGSEKAPSLMLECRDNLLRVFSQTSFGSTDDDLSCDGLSFIDGVFNTSTSQIKIGADTFSKEPNSELAIYKRAIVFSCSGDMGSHRYAIVYYVGAIQE